MIISHSKKFAFLKTRKTAGSSIQVALSTECDPLQDIITGSNIKEGVLDESYSAGWNMDKFFTNHPHPQIEQVKHYLSNKWSDYFKFAFVRNPFDIAVSRYHWDVKGKGNKSTSKEGFNEWVKIYKSTSWQDEQWRYICVDGKNELDFIGRYENLTQDYNLICDKIGITPPQLGFQNQDLEIKPITQNIMMKNL